MHSGLTSQWAPLSHLDVACGVAHLRVPMSGKTVRRNVSAQAVLHVPAETHHAAASNEAARQQLAEDRDAGRLIAATAAVA